MTAKEYLEHDNTIWKKIDDKNLTKAAMIEFAQNYHESEVKNLGLFSVSGSVFKANDVDGAYFLGVFNSGGIDRLQEELKRVKELNIMPHKMIEVMKSGKTDR